MRGLGLRQDVRDDGAADRKDDPRRDSEEALRRADRPARVLDHHAARESGAWRGVWSGSERPKVARHALL